MHLKITFLCHFAKCTWQNALISVNSYLIKVKEITIWRNTLYLCTRKWTRPFKKRAPHTGGGVPRKSIQARDLLKQHERTANGQRSTANVKTFVCNRKSKTGLLNGGRVPHLSPDGLASNKGQTAAWKSRRL